MLNISGISQGVPLSASFRYGAPSTLTHVVSIIVINLYAVPFVSTSYYSRCSAFNDPWHLSFRTNAFSLAAHCQTVPMSQDYGNRSCSFL